MSDGLPSEPDAWPADTTDLRAGAPVDDDLLALVPLVGRWEGTGEGVDPLAGTSFRFAQRLAFAHDGRRFLVSESRTARLDEQGAPALADERETGFWRIGAAPDGDDLDVQLMTADGVATTYVGRAGDGRWELASTSVVRAGGEGPVVADRRLYALLGEELVYVTELTVADGGTRPHLTARLHRVAPD